MSVLMESATPTPYAVYCYGQVAGRCNDGQLIYLTSEGYLYQLHRPDRGWECPRCGSSATWSDENYEARIEEEAGDGE